MLRDPVINSIIITMYKNDKHYLIIRIHFKEIVLKKYKKYLCAMFYEPKN